MKPNGKNERIKREYARYLRDARQQSVREGQHPSVKCDFVTGEQTA
jgi:hypothetical protein